MVQKGSLILFGEGKSDAIFLRHICAMYREELKGTRIKIDAGQGGSPEQIILRLINKHLRLASYDRVLVLLDEDFRNQRNPSEMAARATNRNCRERSLLSGGNVARIVG